MPGLRIRRRECIPSVKFSVARPVADIGLRLPQNKTAHRRIASPRLVLDAALRKDRSRRRRERGRPSTRVEPAGWAETWQALGGGKPFSSHHHCSP
jgi:hypothetical protein